jgi:hypothetical protein
MVGGQCQTYMVLFKVPEHTYNRCCHQLSLCLRFRCFLVQGQDKIKWSLHSQAPCSLNEGTIHFSVAISWVLANIMTECSHCSGNATETQDAEFYIKCCLKFGQIIILCTSSVGSWWIQLGVIAASRYYPWWKDALLVTFMRRLWSDFPVYCGVFSAI